jgi:hypothetical protein
MTVIQRVGGLGVSTSGMVGVLTRGFAASGNFLLMKSDQPRRRGVRFAGLRAVVGSSLLLAGPSLPLDLGGTGHGLDDRPEEPIHLGR